ncbi:MerR family transcriptional regulator [Arsenicicoccus piscis]|nr:MerR family transcriptional regulator [Arsenicicoccus piscis]MCH8627514.1 MerR family transcriptional regulator [Arsenicicoccus piscis]
MLTISQLAAYAGVTVRAVRHYHRVGLLAEPERDHSGYRVYGAGDVVRLIRIRTLAEAGVPLARVRELLDADPETFATALDEIDRRLRVQIRALQQHRRQIRLLESSETLVDAFAEDAHPVVGRLRDRLAERGWSGWTRVKKRSPRTLVREADQPTVVSCPTRCPRRACVRRP